MKSVGVPWGVSSTEEEARSRKRLAVISDTVGRICRILHDEQLAHEAFVDSSIAKEDSTRDSTDTSVDEELRKEGMEASEARLQSPRLRTPTAHLGKVVGSGALQNEHDEGVRVVFLRIEKRGERSPYAGLV